MLGPELLSAAREVNESTFSVMSYAHNSGRVAGYKCHCRDAAHYRLVEFGHDAYHDRPGRVICHQAIAGLSLALAV